MYNFIKPHFKKKYFWLLRPMMTQLSLRSLIRVFTVRMKKTLHHPTPHEGTFSDVWAHMFLLLYISGVQLTMKAPILTRVTSSKTGNFESAFTVSMCVQTEKDHPLPEPTNQSVFIEQFPAMHVFVRSVEGLISDEKWLWEARKFAEMLQNTENVRTDVYFTATFENPLQLLCKNNEIWLVKYENEGSIVPFAKQNTMNIGHHRITMPPIVVRLTSFIISYVTFLVACFHICLNFGTFVRSNSDALLNALKSTVNSLAQRNAISRIAYVMLASALRRCLLFTQWFNKRANSWVWFNFRDINPFMPSAP